MSARGARRIVRGKGAASEIDFVPVNAIGHPVITAARAALRSGLDGPEASSLFVQIAAVLAQLHGGLSREEFLAVCAHHFDSSQEQMPTLVAHALTSPGGAA